MYYIILLVRFTRNSSIVAMYSKEKGLLINITQCVILYKVTSHLKTVPINCSFCSICHIDILGGSK